MAGHQIPDKGDGLGRQELPVVPGALQGDPQVVKDGVRQPSSEGWEGTVRVNTDKAGRVQSGLKAGAEASIPGVPFLEEGVELIAKLGDTIGHPITGCGGRSAFIRATLGRSGKVFGCPDLPGGFVGTGEQVPKELEVVGLLPHYEQRAVEAPISNGGWLVSRSGCLPCATLSPHFL